jgi:hypothetical protein
VGNKKIGRSSSDAIYAVFLPALFREIKIPEKLHPKTLLSKIRSINAV